MPLFPTIGRTVGTSVRAARLLVRGSLRGSVWATRRVGSARAKGAANEIGMVRLFDLHAISCAGDTLIAIGLAGTIFFTVPLDEARSKVALYLFITMVPFALLAPVIGPVLDHFRHGRRYALAVTFLGRAFLAWLISDHLHGLGLYPAVFGVLALSRAYGVARSAAVPRLLPEGLGLSQVGARASVYGTFAGAIVAPIGLAAFWFGPQWSLRVASVIFLAGMVISLRLPPRADSDPPEAVPRPFRTMLRLRRGTDRPLSGRLVIATLIGSASFRCLYGFLLLYFAFAVKAGDLDTHFFGRDIGSQAAVALVGGSLAVGTFLATAIGTRLRIRRPLALQSSGLTITAGVAVLATIFYDLPMVALLALVAAIFSGISKLAIDASIQERVPERLRASAFAHSETVLMMAWVVGGAVGIIPLAGRTGVALAAAFAVAAAVRAGIVAGRLHNERLQGRPDAGLADLEAAYAASGEPPADDPASSAAPVSPAPAPPPSDRTASLPTAAKRGASERTDSPSSAPKPGLSDRTTSPPSARPGPSERTASTPAPRAAESDEAGSAADTAAGKAGDGKRGRFRLRRGGRSAARPQAPEPEAAPAGSNPAEANPAGADRAGAGQRPGDGKRPAASPSDLDPAPAPPGYHIYRPSSASDGNGASGNDGTRHDSGTS